MANDIHVVDFDCKHNLPHRVVMMYSKKYINSIIRRASLNMIDAQKDVGYFDSDIYLNAVPVVMSLIGRRHMNILDKDRESRLVKWLIKNQNEDGSWGLVHGFAPPLASLTHQAVHALELCDDVPIDIIENARNWYRESGSTDRGRTSRIILGLIGKDDWNDFQWPSIYFLFIPGFLNKFPVWMRDVIVSGMIIKTIRGGGISSNLLNPIRNLALSKAEKYLLNHQQRNGSWYGTFQPTIFSMMALTELGYRSCDEPLRRAVYFLDSLETKDGYVSRFKLTVWNTVLALMALSIIDDYEDVHRNCVKGAVEFLLQSQLSSGAFAFNHDVTLYPDVDTTAMAAFVLKTLLDERCDELGLNGQMTEIEDGINKALRWVFDMQNSNGGWATFSKNQCKKLFKTLPSYLSNPKILTVDPVTPDVTSHVLLALGANGYSSENRIISKAVGTLRRQQMPDGSWYGRWGLCYIYGTSSVLEGLHAIGEDMNQDWIKISVRWLLENQNEDGGWGEGVMSYFNGEYIKETSTIEHTSWALIGLCTSSSPDMKAIKRGCEYIIKNWSTGSGWQSYPAVAAFDVYENNLYSKVYPIIALYKYNILNHDYDR